MSCVNVFQIAKCVNSPPGLVHPMLIETYVDIDKRLEEISYNYALTSLNMDEYAANGLLNEHWSWVDDKLEELFGTSDIDSECETEDISVSSSSLRRGRAETDISDYESEIATIVNRLKNESPELYQ